MLLHRLAAALLAVFALAGLTLQAAHAGCGGKLGTHREITISPAQHSVVNGYEKSLGLRDKEVILTFDDGPLSYTSKVLTALRDECVRATFFVVGRHVARSPSKVRSMAGTGHTIAHHTWAHERLPSLSDAKMERAIDRGVRAVNEALYGEATTKARIPFFRYPYLAKSKRTAAVLKRKGLIEIGANIDTRDWTRQSPMRLHNRIMRQLREKKRGIVLLHDIQPRTASMLPRLLRSMKAAGFKVVHMVPSDAAPKAPVVASLKGTVTPKAVVAAKATAPDVIAVSAKPKSKKVEVAALTKPAAAKKRTPVRKAAKKKVERKAVVKKAAKKKVRKARAKKSRVRKATKQRVVRKAKKRVRRKRANRRTKRRIVRRNLGARFIIQ